MTWKESLDDALRKLPPGYFALVMATGIISIAAQLLGFTALANPLFWLNLLAYGILWLLTLLRLARHSGLLAADLTDPSVGSGFLTTVAATGIVGSQFVVLDHNGGSAFPLWLLACALWSVFTYAFLVAAVSMETKRPLEEVLDGGWLLLVVSTQSIAVLATLVAPFLPSLELALHFVGLAGCCLGAVLYLVLIALILYRLLFRPLRPEELRPNYWISMGAAAITTLAATSLIRSAPNWPLLQEVLPALILLALAFWAVATWWIPLLVCLEGWRYLRRRIPVSYEPRHWSMVFPLGMYATCTFELGKAIDLPFLLEGAGYFFFVALAVWTVVLLGLLHSLWSRRA